MTKLERFLSEQTPEALEKAGFGGEWFDREYEWYTENLSFALSNLLDTPEEVMEIIQEEIDIISKLRKCKWGR